MTTTVTVTNEGVSVHSGAEKFKRLVMGVADENEVTLELVDPVVIIYDYRTEEEE